MAPSSFLGNIIISTAWWKYHDDIRHPSCCWRAYLCIAQLVFWRKWGNLITIPIVSASHQSLFLSSPLDKKGRSDQVASKTRVALNKNGIFGILAHPCDHWVYNRGSYRADDDWAHRLSRIDQCKSFPAHGDQFLLPQFIDIDRCCILSHWWWHHQIRLISFPAPAKKCLPSSCSLQWCRIYNNVESTIM